jgi:hypothetical protein
MQEFAPNLSKIIPGRISKKRTVAQGLLGRKWVSNRWGGGGGAHTVEVIIKTIIF